MRSRPILSGDALRSLVSVLFLGRLNRSNESGEMQGSKDFTGEVYDDIEHETDAPSCTETGWRYRRESPLSACLPVLWQDGEGASGADARRAGYASGLSGRAVSRDPFTPPDVVTRRRHGQLWSLCGKRIDNTSQAIAHSVECCSVGVECEVPNCKRPEHTAWAGSPE